MALILFEKPVPTSALHWDDAHELAWVVHTGDTHGEDDARRNIEAAGRLAKAHGLNRVRIVVDMRQLRSISREARALYAGPDNGRVISAAALVIDSSISRVIANFFFALNTPMTPSRMFTETTAALAWLSEFSNE